MATLNFKNSYTITKAKYHCKNLYNVNAYNTDIDPLAPTLQFEDINARSGCAWEGRYSNLSDEQYITSLIINFLNKNADNDAHGRYGEDFKFSIDNIKFIPNNLSSLDNARELNKAREEGYKAVVLSDGGDFKNATLLKGKVSVVLLEKDYVFAPYYSFSFSHQVLEA